MHRHRARLPFLLLLALLPRVGSAVPVETRAYVVTTDFATGSLSWVDLATRAVSPDAASVHADATLRWWGGRIYVVNRFGQDNIQVIDPAQSFATVRQFSTGAGSNPQDIAVVSASKAYVSCLGLDHLLIVDPAAGSVTGSIPLAGFADSDGLPEAARMVIADGRLFVALQRLVNFAPTDTSQVAVVDLATDTVLDVDPGRPGVQAIPLVGRNPVTRFDYDPFARRLLMGCAGAYATLDGGIEAIPLPTEAPPPGAPLYQSAGFVVTEAELGGDVGAIAFLMPGHSFAIVSDASYDASVVSWSAVTGQRLGTLYAPGGFSLPDLAVSLARDELWVCDSRVTSPGLHVFQCAGESHLAGPLDAGLPPYQIVFDRDDVNVTSNLADVPEALGTGAGLALSMPRPQPARGAVSVTLASARAGAVAVDVLDVAGRRVRALARDPRVSGETRLTWDLRDDAGNLAAPGVYLICARTGGLRAARRLVVAR